MKFDLSHPLFQAALPVLEHIESHGYEAYFVGGCVRDTVLDLPIHDIDIASSATPDEIETIFTHTFEVGKKHGTIIVLHDNIPYEITTFRTEGTYSDFRRPDDVTFVRNLEEDTLRRDFTINALAFDHSGNLYDYHDGMTDMAASLLRAVGNATDRFNEDALRMLRAIRFASQLDFDIETETFSALQNMAPLIEHVSIERIRIEVSKYLQGNYFPKHYQQLTDSQLVNYMPLLKQSEINQALKQMANVLNPLIEQEIVRDERLCWALMLYYLDSRSSKVSRKILRTWKHSNQFIQDVDAMIKLLEVYEANSLDLWTIYQYPKDIVDLIDQFMTANSHSQAGQGVKLYEELPIKTRTELAMNGGQLMEYLGMSKGTPLIGCLIESLELQVVTKQLPNETSVLANYAQKYVQNESNA